MGMTCKERILAALRGREVDYVPMFMDFWDPYIIERDTGRKREWRNERERLAVFRDNGWDTAVRLWLHVSPSAGVKTELRYEEDGQGTVLHQKWHTPAGTITEKLRVTEDWPEAAGRTDNLEFGSDFRTPRYIETPFKSSSDLDALEYLFPESNPADEKALRAGYVEGKALADEFNVPLIVYVDAGLDWLIWLNRPEEAVYAIVDGPEDVKKTLRIINGAKQRRLRSLLDWGVDAVIRRGWYESTDFWSPDIFREFAMPALREEIGMVHEAGGAHIYLMMTGIMPLLPDLAALPFDCLCGAEPALGGQDLGAIKKALPGKSVWGGISGPEHLSKGSPERTARAVREAFDLLGKTGSILGTGVCFRKHWPWENFHAMQDAWKALRK